MVYKVTVNTELAKPEPMPQGVKFMQAAGHNIFIN